MRGAPGAFVSALGWIWLCDSFGWLDATDAGEILTSQRLWCGLAILVGLHLAIERGPLDRR